MNIVFKLLHYTPLFFLLPALSLFVISYCNIFFPYTDRAGCLQGVKLKQLKLGDKTMSNNLYLLNYF